MKQATMKRARMTISMPGWVREIVERAVSTPGYLGDMSSWVAEAIVEKAEREKENT